MSKSIFTFALHTDKDVLVGSLFSTEGDLVGRVIHKFLPQTTEGVVYDIETTEDTFEKIDSGEIKLWGIDNYFVTRSNTTFCRE